MHLVNILCHQFDMPLELFGRKIYLKFFRRLPLITTDVQDLNNQNFRLEININEFITYLYMSPSGNSTTFRHPTMYWEHACFDN